VAGLILDTGAVVVLVAGFVRAHAITITAVALLVVVAAEGWRRLRAHRGPKKRGRAGAARRSNQPRQRPAGAGRGRPRAAKGARAK
jgi:hypothetical protein